MKKPTARTAPTKPADDFDLGDLSMDLGDLSLSLDSTSPLEKDVPDPLADVEYSGDISADAKAELTAMQKAFRQRANSETAVNADSNDSETWFCMYFQSRAQKEAFLAAMKWDKQADKYIDGEAAANKAGIQLPPVKLIPFRGGRGKVANHPRIR